VNFMVDLLSRGMPIGTIINSAFVLSALPVL
jgi:hypothetical protein